MISDPTQSRSGLLAMLVFGLLTARRLPRRYLLLGLVIFGLVLLLAPHTFWMRMTRSLTLQKGSFEVYTGVIRVFGYVGSLRAFLHNWLFGVGYLAGRYVSDRYNELRIVGLVSENYFLETAVGMGIIGISVMVRWIVRLFQLGRAIERVTPPGTLGHALARVHTPIVIATMTVCLTGDHWVGMVGIGQLALWCALLTRAGHLAVPRAEA